MSKSRKELPGRPVCEFYTHFAGSSAYPAPQKPQTYHRSKNKALPSGVKKSELSFIGNQAAQLNGSAPKTGNFYSPFHFSANKKTLAFDVESTSKKTFTEKAYPYDTLLHWQKNLARHAVGTLAQECPELKANQDNDYPCLLFCVENRGPEKNPEIWSSFVMRYVIAFANALSYEQGLNIELVARSSFDCLRPSISPCGESVRVSFGLAPNAYVDVVCEAIQLAFDYLKKDYFHKPVDAKSLRKTLATYNTQNQLTGNQAVRLGENVWESMWLRGDSKGCSFATQLFRTSASADALTRRIMQAAIDDKKILISALENSSSREKILIEPLQTFFKNIEVVQRGKASSVSVKNDKNNVLLNTKLVWLHKDRALEDEIFSNMLQYFLRSLGICENTQTALLAEMPFERLYFELENILWEKSHHLPKTLGETSEDGYGSDSDTEGEEDDILPKLYAKKCVTATGMRAIQLSYAAGRVYLEKRLNLDVSRIGFETEHMYYETEEALSRFAIPVSNSKAGNLSTKRSNIAFVDVNHCNTAHGEATDVSGSVPKDALLCILDITSATTAEIRQHLSALFQEKKKLCAVLLVASGLKNQQAMSDCNPYGEIRIFAKTKDALDLLYKTITSLEKAAHYKHPKESHAIRKHFKSLGFTLRNASIFASVAPEDDTSLDDLELNTPENLVSWQ